MDEVLAEKLGDVVRSLCKRKNGEDEDGFVRAKAGNNNDNNNNNSTYDFTQTDR